MKHKIIFFIQTAIGFYMLSVSSLFSQHVNNYNNLEPKGSYNKTSFQVNTIESRNLDIEMSKKMEGAIEEKALRDKWSYHYKLSNGNLGSMIYNAPVNYNKNGEWKPIISVFKKTDNSVYPYVCEEMNGKLMIPSKNNEAVKMQFNNQQVSFKSLGLRIVDGNNNINLHHQKQTRTASQISEKVIHYSNVYDKTTEHVEIGNDMFSYHLILDGMPNFLNNISSTNSYLEYDILVEYPNHAKPFGFSQDFAIESGIVFVDENNDFVFNITAPLMFDSSNNSENYKYRWENLESGKGILTMCVPISWIKSPERVFPITIDPSVEIYATGSGYIEVSQNIVFGVPIAEYTVTQNNVMKTGGEITISNNIYDKHRGIAQFDVSSLPTNHIVLNHAVKLTSCYANTSEFWVGYGTTSHNFQTGTGSELYQLGEIGAYKSWSNTNIGTSEWLDFEIFNPIITQKINNEQDWYSIKTISVQSSGLSRYDTAQVDFCAHNNPNPEYRPLLFIEHTTKPNSNQSNCNISISVSDTIIQSGENVSLNASGTMANIIMDNNFNTGNAGIGWEATTAATFSNPSCAVPSLDASTFLWMGDMSPHPRRLTSIGYDVSNGGWMTFDLKYSVQSSPAPCEGPDEPQEGVALEYSIDNGNTWTSIVYFHPEGYLMLANPGQQGASLSSGQETPFTSWENYIFSIPQGAGSANTKFRWNQDGSSGAMYDNWGIDNIKIFSNLNYQVYWEHNPSGGNVLTETPTETTTYTAWVTNGIDSCSASVSIEVISENHLVTFEVINANGEISATVDGLEIFSPSTIEEGKDVVFSALPNINYQVKEWKLNDVVVSGNNSNSFILNNLQEESMVTVEFRQSVANINNQEQNIIEIFPNPSTAIFNIQSDHQYKMEVVDIQGRILINKQIEKGMNELDMSMHHDGVYFVKLSNTDGMHVLKINKMGK